MAERTVLLDATAEVRGAHLTLIANGTVAVVSAADFPPGKYPTDIVGRLIGSSHKCVHDSAPAGRPRRGKRVRMRSCQLTSGEVVCRSVDGRLRGPRF